MMYMLHHLPATNAIRMLKRDSLLAIVASVVLASIVWALIAWPRTVPYEWQGPLKSASFAPFRDGQSPLRGNQLTDEQIEADLVHLKGVFQGIRTYSAASFMATVPPLAAKHGFQLTHGAWLGQAEDDNRREVEALIDAANRYPQAVQRVLVGNEVLLRQDLTAEQLIAHIDRVRTSIKQPVSYADVWAYWIANPEVAEHVDYITIHVLPYWEDEPVGIDDAPDHLITIIDLIKQRFPDKPILLGETGWPTQGRSRGPAAATLVNAAEYVRRVPQLAEQYGFDYNIVEAFDQSWKARFEGTVGARWGLYDSARHQKYDLGGKVIPIERPLPRIFTAIVLGVIIAMLLVVKLASRRQAILIAVTAQLFAAALVYSVYTAIQLTVAPASITWLLQQWLFYGAEQRWFGEATVGDLYQIVFGNTADILALIWGWALALFAIFFATAMMLWLRALITAGTPSTAARFARSSYELYGIGAIIYAVMFANAGRYLDIPLPHYLLPLTAALMLLLLRRMHHTESASYQLATRGNLYSRFAKILLPLAALYCLWGEISAMRGGHDFGAMHPTLSEQVPLLASSLLANHELLLWCLVCLLLSLPLRASTAQHD
jgi:exo-beta-1,3-glucanase (GH17 family)